jgi:hypothetical protein
VYAGELPIIRPKPAVPGRPTILKRNSMMEKGSKGVNRVPLSLGDDYPSAAGVSSSQKDDKIEGNFIPS